MVIAHVNTLRNIAAVCIAKLRCFKVEKHDSGVKCLSAQLTLPCQFPFVPSAIRQSFDTQIVGSIESFAVPYDVLNFGRRSQANLTGYVKILDKIAVVRI